jgi:hypothetical protein
VSPTTLPSGASQSPALLRLLVASEIFARPVPSRVHGEDEPRCSMAILVPSGDQLPSPSHHRKSPIATAQIPQRGSLDGEITE